MLEFVKTWHDNICTVSAQIPALNHPFDIVYMNPTHITVQMQTQYITVNCSTAQYSLSPCCAVLLCRPAVCCVQAEECLRLEEERVDNYLHASTKPKLLKQVRRHGWTGRMVAVTAPTQLSLNKALHNKQTLGPLDCLLFNGMFVVHTDKPWSHCMRVCCAGHRWRRRCRERMRTL